MIIGIEVIGVEAQASALTTSVRGGKCSVTVTRVPVGIATPRFAEYAG
jgi:hypothetical protein